MSKPLLVIGNKNYSSWSLRAWLMLKHAGINFDEMRVPLFVAGYKEKLLSSSPAGKVPVYREGDLLVWDTLGIGEYLYETQPARTSHPRCCTLQTATALHPDIACATHARYF